MAAKYVNVSIPEGLAKGIDRYIADHPELDLRSRAQVVIHALRSMLIEDQTKKR